MEKLDSIVLEKKELTILKNANFLEQKVIIIEKAFNLLSETRTLLRKFTEEDEFQFPEKVDISQGKISKGENYQSLPYLVLDFPSLFSKKSIFALRTMLWWGKEFSITLHLQGEALEKYRFHFLKNLLSLFQENLYICRNESPWEYHFGKENYLPIQQKNEKQIKEILEKKEFLKISKKIALENWEQIPQITLKTYQFYLQLIK